MSASLRTRVDEALEYDVRPGLSAHAGSIDVVNVDDSGVDLEFVGSCRSCYFRVSCAVNLVAPTVLAAVGRPIPLRIRGVSRAQLTRLVKDSIDEDQ